MKNLIFCMLMSGALLSSSCSKNETVIENAEIRPEAKDPSECDEGDDEQPIPTLVGTVKDTLNLPIYHACVVVRDAQNFQVASIGTDSLGHYFFNYLPNATYQVTASQSGYISSTQQIQIIGLPRTLN